MGGGEGVGGVGGGGGVWGGGGATFCPFCYILLKFFLANTIWHIIMIGV